MENKILQKTIDGFFFAVREEVKSATEVKEIRSIYDEEIGLWEELKSRGERKELLVKGPNDLGFG